MPDIDQLTQNVSEAHHRLGDALNSAAESDAIYLEDVVAVAQALAGWFDAKGAWMSEAVGDNLGDAIYGLATGAVGETPAGDISAEAAHVVGEVLEFNVEMVERLGGAFLVAGGDVIYATSNVFGHIEQARTELAEGDIGGAMQELGEGVRGVVSSLGDAGGHLAVGVAGAYGEWVEGLSETVQAGNALADVVAVQVLERMGPDVPLFGNISPDGRVITAAGGDGTRVPTDAGGGDTDAVTALQDNEQVSYPDNDANTNAAAVTALQDNEQVSYPDNDANTNAAAVTALQDNEQVSYPDNDANTNAAAVAALQDNEQVSTRDSTDRETEGVGLADDEETSPESTTEDEGADTDTLGLADDDETGPESTSEDDGADTDASGLADDDETGRVSMPDDQSAITSVAASDGGIDEGMEEE